MKPQDINILSFNVEGLKPKLDDPNFIDFIQKYVISSSQIKTFSRLTMKSFSVVYKYLLRILPRIYQQKLTIYFSNFEKAILKYKEKGNKLIWGDLNARTGSQGESQHNFDNHLQHLLPEADKQSSDLDRCSCDDKVNASGRTLLEICNNHNLRIGNGQTSVDRLGNYTCFSYEGASVIDYLIVEETIYEKILNFRVLPPTFD